jgi:hypothetical protein
MTASRSTTPKPTPAEVRAEQTKLGWTHAQCGQIIGWTARGWQKVVYGERPMPLVLWHCWRYWSRGRKAPPL